MKTKKSIALFLAAVLMVGTASGCGEKNENDDGKISLSVGLWPDETNPKNL